MGQLISKEIEYNFSDESCFENIRELIRECSQCTDISHMRHILVKNEYIQYKYVSVLLRNILILLKKPVPYQFIRKTKKIEKREAMSVYKSFYESYLTCTFDQFIEEYHKFKDTTPVSDRKSYFLFWVNLINISQILVRFKYDIELNAYLDQDNLCKFDELVQSFIKALSCKYDDILELYKKYIEYAYCSNPKSRDPGTYTANQISVCKSQLLDIQNIDANSVFLLLSMTPAKSITFARFEGTKFIVSFINPYKEADGFFGDIVPTICHDIIDHNMYIRKLALTTNNEAQFLFLFKLNRELSPDKQLSEDYLLEIIFQVFHEQTPATSLFPFSLELFIKNLLSLLILLHIDQLGEGNKSFEPTKEYISEYIQKYSEKKQNEKILDYIYEQRRFRIRDRYDMDSKSSHFLGNTQKQLSDFLFACKFISQELYDELNSFIEIKLPEIKSNIIDLNKNLIELKARRRPPPVSKPDAESIQTAKTELNSTQFKIAEYYYANQEPLFNKMMAYVTTNLPSILATMA
jgi:hypothetical protein